MEELIKRNGNGVWMREFLNVLKRFGASLEWLTERMDCMAWRWKNKSRLPNGKTKEESDVQNKEVEEHRRSYGRG